MSEPYWVALGAAAVDYEGEWAAGTAYAPGDVVTRNGITYLAVNPSTGQTPPDFTAAGAIGTTLPAVPVDGQEFVLVDSLTAPTYAWRFRYLAAKASNRWLFVGGAPLIAEVATVENTLSSSYVALTTPGPIITIPVAGDYHVEHGFKNNQSGATGIGVAVMSYDIGATAAVDADAIFAGLNNANFQASVARAKRKAGLAAVALTAKYKIIGGASGNTSMFAERWLQVTPIAVGG